MVLGGELRAEGVAFHFILNAFWEPLEFELPPAAIGRGPWQRWIDTALKSPLDTVEWQAAPPVPGDTYRAAARSVVLLYAMTS